ncbi:MAG: hypothetical protein H0U57_15180 [Tatlockia sp.]|nr:hypothetical protein [Tatlockia sp.]
MLTKNEINKLSQLHFEIKEEKDLDLCIEHSTNEITQSSIHFTANNLPEEKLISLQQNLKSQKTLSSLSLTANLSCQNSSNIIAELFGSIFENLRHSLVALTLRGLYGENTCAYLAQLIFENSHLTSLSVGAFCKDQSYSGLNKDTALQIANAISANKTLAICDFSLNLNLREGALAIADSLKSNQNLQKIDISNCSLSHYLEWVFLDFLQFNPTIKEIFLDYTFITPTGFSSYIDSSDALENSLFFLENTKQLSNIELTFSITDPLINNNLQRLNLVIQQNKSLKTLQLFNKLDTQIDLLSELTDAIINHPKLEVLVVRTSMGLNDVTIPSYVALINSNSVLTNISVGVFNGELFTECSVTGADIFKALESNSNLTSVDLSNNFFPECEETANSIAKMLKTNKTLKSLNLSNLFYTKGNRAVQIILSALAENQTLTSLNLDTNNSYLTLSVINQLRKNFSLTQLHLLNYEDQKEKKEKFCYTMAFYYENDISKTVSLGIQHIIERNIDLKISSLYQTYLLLSKIGFPMDLNKYIFTLVLAKIGIENLTKISERPYFLERDYLNPPSVEEIIDQKEDHKINYFKTIYKALYAGQSSCFKQWNSLVNKVDLSENDINQYIQINPNSRTAKAWELANDYVVESDFQKTFKTVHQYSYANSSNFFGLFKRSPTFSDGYYYGINYQIEHSKPGSRTKTISEILDSGSIKP